MPVRDRAVVVGRALTRLLLCSTACVLYLLATPASAVQTDAHAPAEPDTSFFEAAVRWGEAGTSNASVEATRLPLHVDPRPLRSDIEGAVLREGDLAEGEASVMEHRRAVLQYLGIPQRDALTYHDECLFACDPRLIKQEEVDRVECPREKCIATVVAVSLPIRPDTTANQDTVHSKQTQTAVRVLRLTPFSAYIYELVFQPEGGTYTIVEQKRVGGGAM